MNEIVGHTVSSVSFQPGHTKYFQTYLTPLPPSPDPTDVSPRDPESTPILRIVDSPGLVWPVECSTPAQGLFLSPSLRSFLVSLFCHPFLILTSPLSSCAPDDRWTVPLITTSRAVQCDPPACRHWPCPAQCSHTRSRAPACPSSRTPTPH
jgi:hypothetical protein